MQGFVTDEPKQNDRCNRHACRGALKTGVDANNPAEHRTKPRVLRARLERHVGTEVRC